MTDEADRAHELAAALTKNSSHAEVLEVLRGYQEAFWPDTDGRPVSPGTIAWFMVVFLPEWTEAWRDGLALLDGKLAEFETRMEPMVEMLNNLRKVAEHGLAESQHMMGDWLLVAGLLNHELPPVPAAPLTHDA